ncbi:hypothetical protein TNCV_100871 [Trichonephila clavipes]|nr:hypothetical protein TNCV_100871 [Trichonephila clavipes]
MSQGSNSSPFDLGNNTRNSDELAGSQSTVQLLLRNFHGFKIRLNSRTQYQCISVYRWMDLKRFPHVKSPLGTPSLFLYTSRLSRSLTSFDLLFVDRLCPESVSVHLISNPLAAYRESVSAHIKSKPLTRGMDEKSFHGKRLQNTERKKNLPQRDLMTGAGEGGFLPQETDKE